MQLAAQEYCEAPSSAEEVARQVVRLASAPQVLLRLNRLLYGGSPSVYEIARVIRLDPGITAEVLRRRNLFPREGNDLCFAVEKAINQLGFARVHELVAQVADEQILVKPLSVYGVDAEDHWRLSVSCALAAELLAEQVGEDTELAYTAGLLHAVGMMALDEWAVRSGPAAMFVPRGFPREFEDSERALVGFTQAEVGAAVLKKWDLPVSISEPIRWQNAPWLAAFHGRMACLLHAAKWLRAAVCTDEGTAPKPPNVAALMPLGISVEGLIHSVVEVRIRLGQMRNLLEID